MAGAPLSAIKIIKYCGAAWGRGIGGGGGLKSYRNNDAPSLSLRLMLSIVAYGEGTLGAPKSYKR